MCRAAVDAPAMRQISGFPRFSPELGAETQGYRSKGAWMPRACLLGVQARCAWEYSFFAGRYCHRNIVFLLVFHSKTEFWCSYLSEEIIRKKEQQAETTTGKFVPNFPSVVRLGSTQTLDPCGIKGYALRGRQVSRK